MRRVESALLAALGLGSLVLFWTCLVGFGVVPRQSLPYPTEVATALPGLLTDGDFVSSLGDTLASWIVALVTASLLAVAVGLLISTLAWLTSPSTLVVNVFRSIPSTSLIPLAILVFGLGMQMKVSVAAYAAFWIVLINTVYGVQSTEPMRKDAARSMRWGWWRTHAVVTIPSALPSIVTGVRIASGTALVIVLSAELLGARSGLGTLMVQYQQALRIDAVYGLLVVIAVIGAALYGAMVTLESRTLKWVRHA